MSLHEIDLATKISDYVCCVKGEVISKCGPPDEIFDDQTINSLYEVSWVLQYAHGQCGADEAGGQSKGICRGGGRERYSLLQSFTEERDSLCHRPPDENDVDYQVAKELSDRVVSTPAFACLWRRRDSGRENP
ncbi:MAG: hypothetical protein ACLR23_21105 [Clostridia bacterium]